LRVTTRSNLQAINFFFFFIIHPLKIITKYSQIIPNKKIPAEVIG
jgi:hypothetical protein